MKKQLISTLLVAVLAASSALAQAQPDRGGPGGPGSSGPAGGPGHSPGKGPGNGHNGPPGKPPQAGPGHSPQRGPDHGHSQPPRRPDPAPARWGKGERVPQPYRGPQYVIDDWRGYHLKQPPRGYQWIGVGADYFLIGVATGVVLESVFGR